MRIVTRRLHFKRAEYNLFNQILTDDYKPPQQKVTFPKQPWVKSYEGRNPTPHLVRLLATLPNEPTVSDIHEASLRGEWSKVWALLKVPDS